MEAVLDRLLAELPGLVLMAFFAFTLLRMVGEELRRVALILERIDERTEACLHAQRQAPN